MLSKKENTMTIDYIFRYIYLKPIGFNQNF